VLPGRIGRRLTGKRPDFALRASLIFSRLKHYGEACVDDVKIAAR